MVSIKFGTDGWRAIMGKEFTLNNVKVVAQGIADYLKDRGLEGRGVIVGYDTRKWSHRFADGVCRVMLGNSILTYITMRNVPTPVAAFEVFERKAGGAVIVTASHNPPEWNGIKYIPDYAGPALPGITEEITRKIKCVLRTRIVKESSIGNGLRTNTLRSINPIPSYVEFVKRRIDTEVMKKANLRVVCDPMHGTAGGYLDRILRSAGCRVTVIHDEVDPSFGGSRPEPIPEFLSELRSKVISLNADLGLATDGDADRLAIFDRDGTYLAVNQLFPMLFDYTVKNGERGGVVRTVATTHLVDRIAEKHGLPVYEVPVGFKYVGQYLREKDIVIGGEESGGISFKGHISEKDGIFASVKVAEMRAKTKKTLSQSLRELQSEYGLYLNGRDDVQCRDDLKQVVMEKLSSDVPEAMIGIRVSSVNKMDGLKLVLEDGGWLLIRPSGTEPLLRIYGESDNQEKLRMILKNGKNFVTMVLNENVRKPR